MTTVVPVLSAGVIAGIVLGALVLLGLLSCSIVYVLFQKHCLTAAGNRCSSRFYMWTCMGFTACNQRCVKKGWWQEIDDRVYVGAVPLKCLGHPRKLFALGVRGVVNTMDEYKGPLDAYESFGIEQLHLPVIDHFAPSFDQTVRGVEFIQRIRDAGGSVLVHCKGGHGRSAAIAFAWLLKNRQMSLEEAQAHILTRRKVRKKLYRQKELIRFHRRFVLGLEDDDGDDDDGSGGDSNDLEEGGGGGYNDSKKKQKQKQGKNGGTGRVVHVAMAAGSSGGGSGAAAGDDGPGNASPRKRSSVVPMGVATATATTTTTSGADATRQSPRKRSSVMPVDATTADGAASPSPADRQSSPRKQLAQVAPSGGGGGSGRGGGGGGGDEGLSVTDGGKPTTASRNRTSSMPALRPAFAAAAQEGAGTPEGNGGGGEEEAAGATGGAHDDTQSAEDGGGEPPPPQEESSEGGGSAQQQDKAKQQQKKKKKKKRLIESQDSRSL